MSIGYSSGRSSSDDPSSRNHSSGTSSSDTEQATESDLMTSMVHEFRTPINSIVMLSKLLMEDQQNENGRHRDISSKIHHVGNSLLEIINSYLDYSKTFAGVRADPSYVDLNRVRSSMEGMFYAKSRLKGLTFSWEMDSQLSGKVYTDRFLLEQILKNLLSNAFKYTEAGGVEVRVSFRRSADRKGSGGAAVGDYAVNGSAACKGDPAVSGVAEGNVDSSGSSSTVPGLLSITISDTGIGISKEKQQAIFEEYLQADDEMYSLFGGTGLGLSIAQKAADLLKGTIAVESEPGRGSTFTFSHPVVLLLSEESWPQLSVISREADLEQAGAGRSESDPAPGLKYVTDRAEPLHTVQERWTPYSHEGKPDRLNLESVTPLKGRMGRSSETILLIDDSSLHSMALKEYLESSVASVLQAKSAEEAYRTLDRCEIDTVILDMTLPDASGEDVLNRILENPKWCQMRVIIYTGLPLSDRRLKQPRKIGIPIVTKSVNSYRTLKDTVLETDRVIRQSRQNSII